MRNRILPLFALVLLFSSSLDLRGQNANLSGGQIFDGEPYLAIDPADPRHLVVAWMGYVNLANQFKIKTKTSSDGGQTWSAAAELPHTVTGYSSADPSIAFNAAGEVFACYIDFTGTTPPVTGGVFLCKSTDGGLTWAAPTEVINTTFDGTKWPIDRPWLEIDRSTAASQGNIYVTTFNLNRNNPSYRPYLSTSTDSGASFTTTYVDGAGYFAGSINPLPVCSPAVASDGTWYGAYPSYVPTQSLYAESYLATSANGGASFSYQSLHTLNNPVPLTNFPDAKKGPLLLCDPANPDHLAYIFLATTHGDLDVFLKESTDAGANWTQPMRINDDPLGNGKMQDLLWGDFDEDGDLVVTWRDRRNGADSSYQADSEIFAAVRKKDSVSFGSNFLISDQLVPHDSVLEYAGNDFMCVKVLNDTLHAVWGDVRTGKLNIWYKSMDLDGTLLSVRSISSEPLPQLHVFPNPFAESIRLRSEEKVAKVELWDGEGRMVGHLENATGLDELEMDTRSLSTGSYWLKVYFDREDLVPQSLQVLKRH